MTWGDTPLKEYKHFLKPEEIERMIKAAANSGGPRKDRDTLLLSLLAYTGRRIGEILLIKVGDILEEEKKIIFTILKKRKDTRRLKPINSSVFLFLLNYIRYHNLSKESYLFQSPVNKDRPITTTRARKIVYRYAELAGLPDFAPGKKIHPHTFRHSFAIAATKKLENPGDLRKLQLILEHSKLEITTHYLQYADEEQREIVDNIYS